MTEHTKTATPETHALRVGRERERADVIDFIRYPPGRLPEHVRKSMDELAKAISVGRHAGGAERLYADWVDEAEAETSRLRAEVTRLRARVSVEAKDVEQAGVTRAHVEAWLAANEWETLKHEDEWMSFVAPSGKHFDVHFRDGWDSDRVIRNMARMTGRAGLDILNEMAAMPGVTP